MSSDIWQGLDGYWHHEFSDQLFETEDEAAEDYEVVTRGLMR